MTATTQILQFGSATAGAGGNRLTPTAYAALTTLLADGFQAGTALSVQLNTVWAQSSFLAAGWANWMVGQGVSVPDDGNLTNLVTEITTALTAFVASQTAASAFPVTAAGGTSDAITATYSPAIALVDKQIAVFVATAANTTTTPTFNPNGLGAHTITKDGGQPLGAGDIPGALAVCILEYNLANTRWELLDPAAITAATTSLAGVVVLASSSDVFTGTNTTKAVTPASLAATISASASGYIRLQGGIMIQWGSVNTTTSMTAFSLPTTFPNNIFVVAGANSSNGINWTMMPTSTSQISANNGSSTATLKYIAIGN